MKIFSHFLNLNIFFYYTWFYYVALLYGITWGFTMRYFHMVLQHFYNTIRLFLLF